MGYETGWPYHQIRQIRLRSHTQQGYAFEHVLMITTLFFEPHGWSTVRLFNFFSFTTFM